jgi:hypothetical protein
VSIRATEPDIRALAARLRSGAPIAPAGVARLFALLCDGAGPVYMRGRTQALSDALRTAARWLELEG